MSVSFVAKKNAINNSLDAMVRRSNDSRGYINRVVYKQYQNAQIERWITENNSEGSGWKPNAPKYKKWKRMAYPTAPGRGEKIMIATGRLVGSVIGPNDVYTLGVGDHRKIVDRRSIKIFTVVDYASDAAEQREFMKFSQKTIRKMRDGYARYVRTGRT